MSRDALLAEQGRITIDGGHRRLRTPDGEWYVHEICGANHVSWVCHQDRACAIAFPAKDAERWAKLLGEMSGKVLEAVEPA